MQQAHSAASVATPSGRALQACLRATCRHPGPPRGTALFDADPDLAGHLADGLRQHGCEPRLVRTASLAAAGSTDGAACAVAGQPRRAEHLVLVQDETVAAFAAVAAVALQAVQRARQQGTPVSLVSVPGRAAYSDLGPAADGLHGSQAALGQTRALLTAEQVVTLVEAAGADCEPPEARPAGPQVAPEAGLDPDQERAVEAGCGPTRVLAPAGSGKTRVLTSRVLALLRRGVPPSAILALAFNRRAAEEMAARLQRQGVPVAGRLGQCGVSVRTFHSLGNELVQQHLGWRYDEGAGAVAARIAAEVFARHSGLEPGTYRRAEAQDFVRQHVSRAKTCLLTTAGASLAFDGRQVPYAPLFAAFLEQQRQARHYEYDDMVYLALLLLLRSAGGRHQVQRRFAHVLVDEFQDLNPAQLLLADVLALPQGNLYVVGDDDQVIYGWRGARVEHLLSFEAQHPGASTFLLSTNYRSAQEVVRLSQRLIRCNRRRVPKEIRPAAAAPLGRIDLLVGDTLGAQARQAAAWIRARRDELGCPWDQFAVLARYHAYHYPVALALDAHDIPHTPLPHGALLGQPPARVVQAYLTLLLQPDQATAEHCRCVACVPERHLPRRVLDGLQDMAGLEALARHPDLGEWHRAQASELLSSLGVLRRRLRLDDTPAAQAVAAVLEDLGVRAHYRGRPRPGRAADEAREGVVLDVLTGLAEDAGSCRTLLELMRAPAATDRPQAGGGDGQVLLATIHATKGEGFAHVVLFNLRHEEREDGTDVEDERRVCYVGLTRAIAAAALTVPRGRHSEFVAEIVVDPELSGCRLRRLKRQADRLERQAGRSLGAAPRSLPGRWLHAWLRRWCSGTAGEPPGQPDPSRAEECRLQAARLRWEIGCREALGIAGPVTSGRPRRLVVRS